MGRASLGVRHNNRVSCYKDSMWNECSCTEASTQGPFVLIADHFRDGLMACRYRVGWAVTRLQHADAVLSIALGPDDRKPARHLQLAPPPWVAPPFCHQVVGDDTARVGQPLICVFDANGPHTLHPQRRIDTRCLPPKGSKGAKNAPQNNALSLSKAQSLVPTCAISQSEIEESCGRSMTWNPLKPRTHGQHRLSDDPNSNSLYVRYH
jgi:hypothetical protein